MKSPERVGTGASTTDGSNCSEAAASELMDVDQAFNECKFAPFIRG
jgi:hypothetical protein